jgi:hypothetical protein
VGSTGTERSLVDDIFSFRRDSFNPDGAFAPVPAAAKNRVSPIDHQLDTWKTRQIWRFWQNILLFGKNLAGERRRQFVNKNLRRGVGRGVSGGPGPSAAGACTWLASNAISACIASSWKNPDDFGTRSIARRETIAGKAENRLGGQGSAVPQITPQNMEIRQDDTRKRQA